MIWDFCSRGVLCDIFGIGQGVAGAAQATASVAGAGIQAGATMYAANQAADATKYASDQTAQTAANSLAFNSGVYNTTLGNEQPYMGVGDNAAGILNAGLNNGYLTASYPGGDFHFSGVDLQNDPAYQFDLNQGTAAMDRGAAATGGLISGGQQKALNDYAQGYASNQYQQSYANALAAYQQSYSQFETTQGNEFNRLSSLAGLGQNAVTQTATSGNAAAGTNAQVNASTANTLSNLATSNASVQGAAALGLGNSINNGINGAVNALSASSYESSGAATAPDSLNYDLPAWAQ